MIPDVSSRDWRVSGEQTVIQTCHVNYFWTIYCLRNNYDKQDRCHLRPSCISDIRKKYISALQCKYTFQASLLEYTMIYINLYSLIDSCHQKYYIF